MGRTSIFIGIVLIAWPASAAGQTGLFGTMRQARDVLSLQMSVSEALDSDVAPEVRERTLGGDLPGRMRSSLVGADVGYTGSHRRLQMSLAASGLGRYNYAVDRLNAGAARALADLEFRVPRAGALSVSQSTAYSPSYLYELLPEESEAGAEPPVVPSDAEYRVDRTESFAHRTHLGLLTGSSRLNLATTADYGRLDFRHRAPGLADRITYEAGTRVAYRPTSSRGFFVGYRYRAAEFGPNSTTTSHALPLGFEYRPSISRSRRLAIRIDVAPTMIDMPVQASEDSPGVASSRLRRFTIQGDVDVDYPFHLKWRLAVGYRRGLQYRSVLPEPVLTDEARIRVLGLMGRRVDIALQARYAVAGSAEADAGDGRLATARGEARVRFAVARSLALFTEYLYRFHELGDRTSLSPDLPDTYRQHSVRAGVMLFVQALGR